jgi:hypothetical protein
MEFETPMYARFAPVAPLNVLRYLRARSKYGNCPPYLLVLAHDVAEHATEYTDFFNSSWDRIAHISSGEDQCIILDNSIIELGGQVASDELIFKAANACKPNVVVLPDAFHDRKRTFEMAWAGKERWAKALKDVRTQNGRNVEFMYVLQGENFLEYLAAIDDALAVGATWISVPRNAVKKCGSRVKLTQLVRSIAPQLKIHLLGFSDDPTDDILALRVKGVRGIDSAVPIRMASDHVPLNMAELVAYDKPRGTWWDTAKPNAMMYQNYLRMVQIAHATD